MAKATVYLNDDQLAKLKVVRGIGKGGVSKAFQAFLEDALSGSGDSAGRYGYARQLMPTAAAVERHRQLLAAKVSAGGPPADGGPIAIALAVLLYQEMVRRDPSVAATFEKEFARFGLDELVAAATEGVDLLADPEPDADVDLDEDDPGNWGRGWTGFLEGPLRDVTDALRGVGVMDVGAGFRDIGAGFGRREVRRERGHPVEVDVSSDDDPRDLLTATDFETFRSRHPDWDAGKVLTPSQVESVRDLLLSKSRGKAESKGSSDAAGSEESPDP